MSEVSKVLTVGEVERKRLLAINEYKQSAQYDENNRNAISDGDDKGRGENQSGQVGTSVDISKRLELIARNRYKDGREYSVIE